MLFVQKYVLGHSNPSYNCIIELLFLGATVESVLKELDNDRLQLALYDELRQFTSSFNAYKPNGGEFDRSVYLSAFNGQTLKRQTCNSKFITSF